MRCYVVCITAAVLLALSSGCRGGGGMQPEGAAGTHTLRYYAGMSLPAFLPDGEMFVLHGTQLLKLSPSGEQLGTTELPIPTEQLFEYISRNPRLIGTAGGSVFAQLGDGRIGRINEHGLLEWLQNFGYASNALAFGDGLLVRSGASSITTAMLLNRDGESVLELAGATALPDADATAGSGYAYFLKSARLWVADTTGAWLLQDAELPGLQVPRLLSAVAGRVLLADAADFNRLYCFDHEAQLVWTAPLPDGYLMSGLSLLLPDGSALASLRSFELEQYVVQRYTADGVPERQYGGLNLLCAMPAAGGGFAATFVTGGASNYGLFDMFGELSWAYPRPAPSQTGPFEMFDDRTVYPLNSDCGLGPDGQVYFEWESTLFALDAQGRLAWRKPGYAYVDKVVPNITVPPGQAPGTGGTGANPVAKPAGG